MNDKTEHKKTIIYILLSIIFFGLGIIVLYFTEVSNSIIIIILGNLVGFILIFITVFLLFKLKNNYNLIISKNKEIK